MNNLLSDMKAYLNNVLNLVVYDSHTYKEPYVVAKPNFAPKPVNQIVLSNSVNDDPVYSLGQIKPLAYNPVLQVRVRSEKHADGLNMAWQIVTVIEDTRLSFIGASGDCYGGMLPRQLPGYLGQDANDKHMWSWNYNVHAHQNQTI